ncbi:MAG: polysaccharide biosynthesis tyrosine autokinase [Actinomycetota bacterium]
MSVNLPQATPPHEPGERPVDLREYLAVLRTRKWSIAAITAVSVVAALFFSFRQMPIYESEAEVLVNAIPPSGFQLVLFPAPNLDTERAVASSVQVADLAADRLRAAQDPRELLEHLSVEVATNSEVLIFRYADPRPLDSQRKAQAFAEGYLDFRRQRALERLVEAEESIQQQIDEVSAELRQVNRRIGTTEDQVERANLQTRTSQLAAQLAVLEQEKSRLVPAGTVSVGEVIAPASLPSSPASPNHVLNGMLALLVGLALGVGFAFLRERLDDRLRGQADLEARSGAPVLAVVPRVATWKKNDETPLVTLADPRSGAAEAYRTLRTGLLFAAAERGVRMIMVTSPHPGEGKTATAANLAVVLSQAGRRVIVVSADLRKPRLHKFFGAKNEAGLSLLLTGEVGLREAIQDVGVSGLRVVPSGPVPKNPAELLGSHAMEKALDRFREGADVIVVDSPPVLDVADTITVAAFADAVVMVADAEHTSRGALSHARKQLDQVRAEVIGAVLNNLDPTKARMYPYYYRYYYRYGYQYGPPEPSGAGRRRGRTEPELQEQGEPLLAQTIPEALRGAEPRSQQAPAPEPGPPDAGAGEPVSESAPRAVPQPNGQTGEERAFADPVYEEIMDAIRDVEAMADGTETPPEPSGAPDSGQPTAPERVERDPGAG